MRELKPKGNQWTPVASLLASAQADRMRPIVAIAIMLLGTSACGTGERPFRMVQFCLANASEIEPMKDVLRGIASSNKLPFYDRSTETEAELKSIAEGQKNVPVAHPTVNVGTVGPNRMGFSAGNFPDAPLQIVVGFSKDQDPKGAQELSDRVVQALSQRWHIHEVPNVATSGAFPLKDCSR